MIKLVEKIAQFVYNELRNFYIRKSVMNVKPNDVAILIKADHFPKNVGTIVEVLERHDGNPNSWICRASKPIRSINVFTSLECYTNMLSIPDANLRLVSNSNSTPQQGASEMKTHKMSKRGTRSPVLEAGRLNKPTIITFTGIDECTDFRSMIQLAYEYPVEFGVLFSPTRQGREYRYPSLTFIRDLDALRLNFAAHICGAYANEIAQTGQCDALVPYLKAFGRAQINLPASKLTPDALVNIDNWFSRNDGYLGSVIVQSRDPITFPPGYGNISQLYDPSGGHGITPNAWPKPVGKNCSPFGYGYGYAGGISPANVAEVVDIVGRYGIPYWLDMETHVRTEDLFDINKCRQVCEAVTTLVLESW